jgi:hypothetical protein
MVFFMALSELWPGLQHQILVQGNLQLRQDLRALRYFPLPDASLIPYRQDSPMAFDVLTVIFKTAFLSLAASVAYAAASPPEPPAVQTSGATSTPAPQRFYIGATPASTASEVAILVINRPQPRSRDFACIVERVVPEIEPLLVLPRTGPAYVVVAPGQYRIVYTSRTHRSESVGGLVERFEAGKRYEAHCAGATRNQMKLHIAELPG